MSPAGTRTILEAERSFRDMKSVLSLRPDRSTTASNPGSGPTSCSARLALLLVRVAERRTEATWTTINRQLSRVHAALDPT